MQVGPRNKATAEKLFYKLPESLKKKPSTILTSSMCTTKPCLTDNINQLAKIPEKRLTLKDLTVRLDSAAQD